MADPPEKVVRACFAAYETKDRQALEALLADDFTFTSPIDGAIDRTTYFERCWPNSGHVVKFDLEKVLVDGEGEEVFVRYRVTHLDGSRGTNVECFVVRHGQIRQVTVYFGSDSADSANTAEIKSVIHSWIAAIQRKDVEGTASHFTDDAVDFLLAPPLVADSDLRGNLRNWYDTFEGEIGCELRDLRITAHGDTAFAHALQHLTGTKTSGERPDLWFRLTIGLVKTGPHWKIAHSHESVPFLMDGSGRAALDLIP